MIGIQSVTALTVAFIIVRYWALYHSHAEGRLAAIGVSLLAAYAAAASFFCDISTFDATSIVMGLIVALLHDNVNPEDDTTASKAWLHNGRRWPSVLGISSLTAAALLLIRDTCNVALKVGYISAAVSLVLADVFVGRWLAQTRAGVIV